MPERWDAEMTGETRSGKPSQVKSLNCLRILATACSPDGLDYGSYIAQETGQQYSRQLCRDLKELPGNWYLRRWLTKTELKGIKARYAEIGFLGCAGAMDCMNPFWKSYPYQDTGQMLNSKKSTKLASIQRETWCDHELYCWH